MRKNSSTATLTLCIAHARLAGPGLLLVAAIGCTGATTGGGQPCDAVTPCGDDDLRCVGGICTAAGTCDDGQENGEEPAPDCGGDCAPCPTGSPCTVPSDCTSNVCGAAKTCSLPACDDGVANGGETGVDCGGPCLEKCATGGGCDDGHDCASGVCPASERTCSEPSCVDGVSNGDETGIDCGGSCPACEVGEICQGDGDCESSVCQEAECRLATCDDGSRDGLESDVDCGGPACGTCPTGGACKVASDCQSRVCEALACAAPSCNDGVMNGAESGTDCGGTSCGACPDGERCQSSDDCETGVCVVTTCRPPHCDDGVQNEDETGLDCGGSCNGCPDGDHCEREADCASRVCNDASGLCAEPTCSDGVRNGDETGDDCGQLACATPCGAGGGCVTDHDCETLSCGSAGTCVAASCLDGRQNGNEADIDCGGSCGPSCAAGAACNGDTDCQSGVCTDGSCAAPSCSDEKQNGDETDVDCGGSCITTEAKSCGVGATCVGNGDCASALCLEGTCAAPHCVNEVVDAGETGLNCGGGECPACADGSDCAVPSDCTSLVCGAPSGCTSPPCTCQVPTCTDGVQNGGEVGLDCGTVGCSGCVAGTPCSLALECTSGVCAVVCQEPSCEPPDGVQNGDETGVDCGGPACPACPAIGCTTGAQCPSGVCGPSHECQPPACLDGVKNGTELCDGDDVGSLDCTSLGHTGGALRCNATCDGVDESQCTDQACGGGCSGGKVCQLGACRCPYGMADCGGTCTSLQIDPSHCGSCTTACNAGEACSAGACRAECQPPLQKCGQRCVDFRIDNANCGSCGNACSGGTSCNGGNCLSGGLSFLAEPNIQSKCAAGGPAIELNDGSTEPVPPALSCTGNLAAVSFRWAFCSCSSITLNQPLLTDSYDSRSGPYTPVCEETTTPCTSNGACTDLDDDGLQSCAGGLGGGIGTNGVYSNNQSTRVWGSLWWADTGHTAAPNIGTASVRQELQAGGTVNGSRVTVFAEGLPSNPSHGGQPDAVTVEGSLTMSGRVEGNVNTRAGTTISPTVQGSIYRSDTLEVAEPCDCAAAKLIDVAGIVAAHACAPEGTNGCSGAACCIGANNDNALIALDPGALATGAGRRVDLPCGRYYLSRIVGTSNARVTIVAHGRTALFIDGHVNVAKALTFSLTESAELDIFIKGAVCNNDVVSLGSPSFAARTRVYLGGGPGNTCASGTSRALDLTSINAAANLYAPYGKLYQPQTLLMYGGLFVNGYDISQQTTIHFDSGVAGAGEGCAVCGNGGIEAGEQCDGAALGGQTCASLGQGFTGGTLACTPTCQLDASGCTSSCGDGDLDSGEQCDTAQLPLQFAVTCEGLGFDGGTLVACNSDCTADTTPCTRNTCNDGTLDANEACDTDKLGAATCASLGFDGGTLQCRSNCTIDTTQCYRCGDGIKNGSEQCDGAALGGQTCEGLSLPAGTLACKADCTFDTSGCKPCTSCRDCNNQACISGKCGACTSSSQCCAPLLCVSGRCTLY